MESNKEMGKANIRLIQRFAIGVMVDPLGEDFSKIIK